MWRSKKFIIIGTLIAVAVVVSTTGAVLANEDEIENQPEAQYDALLERVCEIYEENTGVAIDCNELKGAFAQAASESQDAALQNYLDRLVDEDIIAQEEADQYMEWWQQQPDIAGRLGPGPFGSRHTLRHNMRFGPGCTFGGWHGSRLPGPAD